MLCLSFIQTFYMLLLPGKNHHPYDSFLVIKEASILFDINSNKPLTELKSRVK